MKKTKTIRFVDCGGNVGQSIHWSLNILDAFSELFDCNIKVDCFEPYPQLFEIIKGKYSWAPTDKISLHQQAVDVKDGKRRFYLQENDARTSSSFYKGKESTYRQIWVSGDLYYKEKETGNARKLELEWKDPNVEGPVPKIMLKLSPSSINELIHSHGFQPKIDDEELINWIDVETIDIVKWLEESIDPENEIVILKLDIEGTEYSVLNKLLHNDLNKVVDVLLVEWTPEEKIASCEDVFGTKQVRTSLRTEVGKEFRCVLDWHYPEKCVQPLVDYIKNIL